MRIPLGTRSFKNRSLPASTQNLINLYVESMGPDTKEPYIVHRVEGYNAYLEGAGKTRGIHIMDGVLYWVSGTTLYSVSNGVATSRGTIPGTDLVSMASNDRDSGPQLVIVNGTATSYVYTVSGGLTTQTLTGPSYSVTYQDGYFIHDWSGTGKWFISSVLDGTSYDSLENGATNSRPDKVLAVYSIHQQIVVFGENSREHFYNSGNLDFPFVRINEGTDQFIGLGARWSLVQMDDTLFYVGSDREAYRLRGYTAAQISDQTVSEALKDADLSKVDAFSYTKGSHRFYVLNLENISFVYDAKEGAWHQRGHYENGSYSRFRGCCYAYFNGEHIIGDYASPYLYTLSDNVHEYNGKELRWEMVLPPLHNNGEFFALPKLIIDMEMGVGITSGQGSDPKIFVSQSENGRTWFAERWVGLGKIGKYDKQAVINRLGSTRKQKILRIAGSDPVKTTIMSCYVP